MRKQYSFIIFFIVLYTIGFSQSFNAVGFDTDIHVNDDFDRPIIILEGFDIVNNVSASDLYDQYNEGAKVLAGLEAAGYDIIVLSYHDTYKDIHENTAHLRAFIKEVNAAKTLPYENILIGESMGGIIARMALKELEDSLIDHQTGLYISFDAPHKGGNIPEGIQEFAHDLMEVDVVALLNAGATIYMEMADALTFGYFDIENPVNWANTALNSTATRQLLIYSYLNFVSGNNNLFNELQTYLDNLGYPQTSKNIALINGNDDGAILNFTQDANFYNKSWGDCDYYMDYLLNIRYARVNQNDFRVSKIRWRIAPGCVLNGTYKDGHASLGNIFYDNAPGSYEEFDIKSSIGGTGVQQFCFVPTVSAIDLDQSIINSEGLRYFNTNNGVTVQSLVEDNETPFDNIYVSGDRSHVNITNASTQFDLITDYEIMPDEAFIQNKIVNGNRMFSANLSITIGSNVRNFTDVDYNGETGGVSIVSGTTTMSSPEIIIEDSFTVEQGASLIIE